MSRGYTYSKAGVNIDLADEAKKRIKSLVKGTFTKGVMSEIGKFGGMFSGRFPGYKNPVLVSSVDGVGTKLKLAVMMKKYDTVGIDLINHCVDDILVHGAKALFFLDYMGMARTEPGRVSGIIKGFVKACKAEGCALVGGETAQMPDVYSGDDLDLVGLIVGIVEKDRIIDGKKIKNGDVLIGLSSSGLHTNGYTLARKLLLEKKKLSLRSRIPGTKDMLGDVLLRPHKSYSKQVFSLLKKFDIHGMAHITGGGFTDNIPRVLPKGLSAVIWKGSFPILPIFSYIQKLGKIEDGEMHRTFNMGIGMVLMVDRKDTAKVLEFLEKQGEPGYIVGAIVKTAKNAEKVSLI
jgi:phosphoribosylformylglycinamidine cyclo-ligase